MSDELVCEECGSTWPEDKRNAYHCHIYGSHRLDTESYIERYRRIRTEIPDKYHDAYEDLTGSGRAPKSVQAAVCYIESQATMDEAADIFDKSDFTIRKMVNKLIDRGVVTLAEVRENCADNGLQKFGEERSEGLGDGQYDHADIRRIKDDLGLSQREMANRLNVTRTTIQNWQKPDSYNPSQPMADKIDTVFGL